MGSGRVVTDEEGYKGKMAQRGEDERSKIQRERGTVKWGRPRKRALWEKKATGGTAQGNQGSWGKRPKNRPTTEKKVVKEKRGGGTTPRKKNKCHSDHHEEKKTSKRQITDAMHRQL